jgi:hypothetical protein
MDKPANLRDFIQTRVLKKGNTDKFGGNNHASMEFVTLHCQAVAGSTQNSHVLCVFHSRMNYYKRYE